MAIRLVDDVKSAWKWFSVQAMALALALIGAWGALPSDLRAALPPWLVPLIAGVILLAGIAGRLVQQASPPAEGQ